MLLPKLAMMLLRLSRKNYLMAVRADEKTNCVSLQTDSDEFMLMLAAIIETIREDLKEKDRETYAKAIASLAASVLLEPEHSGEEEVENA